VIVGVAVVVAITAATLAGASPGARQVYAPTWMTTVVETGPCALSIVMPASEAERCASWTRRESSGPAFHPGLGVVVTGGSDKHLRALDATSGKTLWTRPTPGAVVAQPVIDAESAFAGTDDARVVRVDVASGRERWVAAVDAEVGEPVVVHEDAVFVVTGADSTYALSKETGEALWVHKHPLPRAITLRGQGRPLPLDVQTFEGLSRRLYVGHASGRLTVLDRTDGRVLTELDLSRGDTFGDLDADPVFHPAGGGRVVVASQTRGIVAVDPKSHVETWRNGEAGITRLATGGTTLVIAAGAGKVVALDAATGANRWRFTFAKGAPTRIVVKGGRVHVGSDRGALYVLDLFSGRPLQYAGSAVGVAGDLALWQDMLFYTSTAGRLVALSNAWPGPVFQAGGNDRVRRP
jgi:outer membrane protein assembly factor BamB